LERSLGGGFLLEDRSEKGKPTFARTEARSSMTTSIAPDKLPWGKGDRQKTEIYLVRCGVRPAVTKMHRKNRRDGKSRLRGFNQTETTKLNRGPHCVPSLSQIKVRKKKKKE